MIFGAFCAVVCVLAPWHAAIEPVYSANGSQPIVMNGVQIGSYVDDTVVDEQTVVAQDMAVGMFVVAGMAPGLSLNRNAFPGAVAAQEWYPYYNDRNTWGPLPPGGQAYIVQGTGSYPGGVPGATKPQQHREWLQAIAQHPVLILTYNGPLLR